MFTFDRAVDGFTFLQTHANQAKKGRKLTPSVLVECDRQENNAIDQEPVFSSLTACCANFKTCYVVVVVEIWTFCLEATGSMCCYKVLMHYKG